MRLSKNKKKNKMSIHKIISVNTFLIIGTLLKIILGHFFFLARIMNGKWQLLKQILLHDTMAKWLLF